MAEVFSRWSVKSGNSSANVSEESELNAVRRLQLIHRSELPLGSLQSSIHGWGKVLTGHLDTPAAVKCHQ